MNEQKKLEEMRKEATTTILKQHCNNNTFCSDWRPTWLWKDDERVSKALKYTGAAKKRIQSHTNI
jgi:hypothetical protein